MSRVAGVLLAAGRSTRLGMPKALLADADGEPLVRRLQRTLAAGGCSPVYVVTGAEADRVAAALTPADPAVRLVHHAAFADGMGTSIAAGVRAAMADGADAVLVATCDMPAVTASHVAALLAQSGGGRRRVASAYPAVPASAADRPAALVRGVPAVFPVGDLATLAALEGDRGARALIRGTGTEAVLLPDGHLDLDTPADVARWQASTRRVE